MSGAISAAVACYRVALDHERACRAALVRHVERCEICSRRPPPRGRRYPPCAVWRSAVTKFATAQTNRTTAERGLPARHRTALDHERARLGPEVKP